jgi:hypothetical protein
MAYNPNEVDDEDWYDDQDDLGDEETAVCPECGEPVPSLTDKCPWCGYWLSAADRRAIWSRERKPRWLRVTAWVVLALFLIPAIAVVMAAIRRAGNQ